VILQKLVVLIPNGNWYCIDTPELLETIDKTIDIADLKMFRNVKYELTVHSDSSIILRGSTVVVPRNLQENVLNSVHGDHKKLIKSQTIIAGKGMISEY